MGKLHTDALEQKYGPIRAVVLRHDIGNGIKDSTGRIRETKLVDGKGIMRTYALTLIDYYTKNEQIAKVDDEIRQGGLIGRTFRKYSYSIKRNIIDIFDVHLPHWMQKDFKVDEKKAKARLVEFCVRKDGSRPVSYGVILEISSPDFEAPCGAGEMEKDNINPSIVALQKAGIPMDEIWNSLGGIVKNNIQRDKYEKAQKLSRPLLKLLNSKIASQLRSSLLGNQSY